jgi:hypothetical protein
VTIACLLWDFGDTLCDERFIWSSGAEWRKVYELFDDGFADEWNTGVIDDLAFAHRLTQHISMSAENILAHMQERCRHVEFYDFTYSWFRARNLPQAIVTVNPRLWSEVISPLYSLHDAADVIVTSWEEGTTHKATLCDIALRRLSTRFRPGESLLIDNRSENIEAWRSNGGCGYLFTSDEQFKKDMSLGLDALAARPIRSHPR